MAPLIARRRTCVQAPDLCRRCSDSSPVIAGRIVPRTRARLRPIVRAAIVVRGATRTGVTALVSGVSVCVTTRKRVSVHTWSTVNR